MVEDLKELVLNYCGSARAAGWCQDDRYFLALPQISHCLSQVRDELMPLPGPA